MHLSKNDIELIAAALHTQEKIFAVQKSAGGAGAARKLEELEDLSRRLSRARMRLAGCDARSWLPAIANVFRRGQSCGNSV